MLDISFYNLLAEISNNLHFQDYSSTVNPVLKPAFQFISENNISKVTVARLARACQLSPSGFRSLFKAHTGKSPSDYIRELRMTSAARMLLTSDREIAEIGYQVGFSDANYFSRTFRQVFGVSPHQYRRISRGQAVRARKESPKL